MSLHVYEVPLPFKSEMHKLVLLWKVHFLPICFLTAETVILSLKKIQLANTIQLPIKQGIVEIYMTCRSERGLRHVVNKQEKLNKESFHARLSVYLKEFKSKKACRYSPALVFRGAAVY